METRVRLVLAMGVALGLHAPVALLVRAARTPALESPVSYGPVSYEESERRIDVELAAPSPDDRAPLGADMMRAELSPRAPASTTSAFPGTGASHTAEAAVPSAIAGERSEPLVGPTGPSWSIAFGRPAPPSLDVPRTAHRDVTAEALGEAGPRAPTAIDSVHAALDDHDRQLGLGGDGPIGEALRRVAMGSRVPVVGSATLAATVDGSGNVVAVTVVKSSGDRGAWDEVAAGVLESLRNKRLRVPGDGHGLTLGFSVESRARKASGHVTDSRSPVFVSPDNAHAERAPSLTFGTPVYRCLESCTGSANIDPTDALVNATSGTSRTISVTALPPQRTR